jgi:hypothetical protein
VQQVLCTWQYGSYPTKKRINKYARAHLREWFLYICRVINAMYINALPPYCQGFKITPPPGLPAWGLFFGVVDFPHLKNMPLVFSPRILFDKYYQHTFNKLYIILFIYVEVAAYVV